MVLKMVDHLFLTRVTVRLDLLAQEVVLEPVAARLPLEMVVRVTRRRLQPELLASSHGCSDQGRVVAREHRVAELVRVKGWCRLDGLLPLLLMEDSLLFWADFELRASRSLASISSMSLLPELPSWSSLELEELQDELLSFSLLPLMWNVFIWS